MGYGKYIIFYSVADSTNVRHFIATLKRDVEDCCIAREGISTSLTAPIKYVVCPRSDFSSAMYKSTGLHFSLVLFNMLYSGMLSLISSMCHFFLFAEVRFLLSADAFKRLLVLNLLQKSSTQLSFQLEVSKIRPSKCGCWLLREKTHKLHLCG